MREEIYQIFDLEQHLTCPNLLSRCPVMSASMPSLIWIATRGVMEILGLVPCQSETREE